MSLIGQSISTRTFPLFSVPQAVPLKFPTVACHTRLASRLVQIANLPFGQALVLGRTRELLALTLGSVALRFLNQAADFL